MLHWGLGRGVTASEVLEEEDFERAWAVRSYTDRGDGMTTAPWMSNVQVLEVNPKYMGGSRVRAGGDEVVASHVAPRALPRGCSFGTRLLQEWLLGYAREGILPELDPILTRRG